MPFDGFISYRHAADGRLAPAVQRGRHRRALWIFRDQTGPAVTPRLWSSIQETMDGSRHFVSLWKLADGSDPVRLTSIAITELAVEWATYIPELPYRSAC